LREVRGTARDTRL